jgi:hypothetical protein
MLHYDRAHPGTTRAVVLPTYDDVAHMVRCACCPALVALPELVDGICPDCRDREARVMRNRAYTRRRCDELARWMRAAY